MKYLVIFFLFVLCGKYFKNILYLFCVFFCVDVCVVVVFIVVVGVSFVVAFFGVVYLKYDVCCVKLLYLYVLYD